MENKIYPKGVICFNKSDNAPDFVVGIMKITLNDFITWAKQHPDCLSEYKGNKQLTLTVAHTRDGRLSVYVDTWKPEPKQDDMASDIDHFDATDDLPF